MAAIADDAMKLLECPVCLLPMAAPIEICGNGHDVCKDCRKKADECPLCKARYTGIRNLTAEAFAAKVLYPCVNAKAGCSVKVPEGDLSTHINQCPLREYKCFVADREACGWTGHRAEILQHFQDKHKKYVQIGDNITWAYQTYANGSNPVYPPILISAHDEVFFFRSKFDAGRQTWFYFVEFIGPEERASEFRYNIEFQCEDNIHKVIFCTNTHSDVQGIQSIMESFECMQLSNVMLKRYFLQSYNHNIQILKNYD